MSRFRRPELLLLIGSLAFVLLAAELALRAYQRFTRGTPMLSLLPSFRVSTFRRSPFLVFGPRVGETLPGTGPVEWRRFNERGLRYPFGTPSREPGELRLLTLGGSTSEDAQNPLGIHWSLGLECLQRGRGREDIRVLNGGMSAYSTAHSVVQYQFDLVETQPDFVLILHNINDLIVTYHAASLGRTVDPTYLVRYGTKRFTATVDEDDIVFSRLANLARSRLARSEPTVPYQDWKYDLSVSEAIFRRNLRTLVGVVRASGATPVLLTMPRSSESRFVEEARRVRGEIGLTHFPEMDRFLSDFARFNSIIREVAVAERVPLADVAAVYPDSTPYFADMVHYTTAGVRRFATIMDSIAVGMLPPGSGVRLADSTRVTCTGVMRDD
jgi:lysophospholipase L1-like esterase